MKIGTTRPPWRYDVAARHARQSANIGRPTILHYASTDAGRSISGQPNGWTCKKELARHAAVWTSRSTSGPTSRIATARSY
jgi:hypothetical protein